MTILATFVVGFHLLSDWCLPGKSWFLIGSGLVKSIVGREAINELSSKADRPISLMESLITDRQAQVTDQGLCLTYYSKLILRFSPRIPDSYCCVAKNRQTHRLADYPQVLDRVSLAEYRIFWISFFAKK